MKTDINLKSLVNEIKTIIGQHKMINLEALIPKLINKK